MLKDDSGATTAEYALILAIVGGALALASATFGTAVARAGDIAATGPDGVVHRCTSNCQYDYNDYCAAVARLDEGGPDAPTFDPAIGGTCNGEIPVS